MAYYNHEHYKNPVEATIFAKENISKWRVVKVEPEPEILRKSQKPKTRVMRLEQEKAHKEALARKLEKCNTTLKNYARNMDNSKNKVQMVFEYFTIHYKGKVRKEFEEEAKAARDAIIENSQKLKAIFEMVIVENGGTLD